MGMYTEIVFASEIKNNSEVIKVLKAYESLDFSIEELPEHPFFKTPRWHMVMCGMSSSFPGVSQRFIEQTIFNTYKITFRANLKNYDNEIELFLDWIEPYILIEDELLGYFRYEEDDFPTLIYKIKGKIRLIEIKGEILYG